ncbi:MAG: SDR family NAD(P)-dependent oxidoreductase [Planctomycetota bacterium]|jgi:NAD(P)-dependent dehydrogenase (short-subunit alcohol dehydrogenase family)
MPESTESAESARPGIAIVTGAGSGLGRAVAEGLLAEGRTVLAVGRRIEPLRQVAEAAEAGGRGRAIPCTADLGADDAAAEILKAVRSAGGAGGAGLIDTVVNNAGLAELAAFEATDAAMFARSLAVNLLGPVRLLQAAWPDLIASGRGRVVNISSMATADPFDGFLAYAAAKSGLESVTRSLAREGAASGIEAWTVAPGAIETPMLRGLFDESMVPREAAMDPAEVAAVVLDLLTGRRTATSGATIRMPGPGRLPIVG